MATVPSGNFCLLMSLRSTEETVAGTPVGKTPEPAIAASSSNCRKGIRTSLPASPTGD